MPAAAAACTPVGASSNTRQEEGCGAGVHWEAAHRKMSGAGLPLLTWSPAAQQGLGQVGQVCRPGQQATATS